MTQSIFTKLIHFCFFVFFLLSPTPSDATTLEEAEAALTRAHNQYFDALQSSSMANPKDKEELRKKILAPAIAELDQVMRENNQKFAEKYFRFTTQEEFDQTLAKAERDMETLKQNDEPRVPPPFLKSVVNFLFSSSDSSHIAPQITEKNKKTTTQPEIVLDNKDIPAEIEFPGKKPEGKPEKKKETISPKPQKSQSNK